MFKILAIALLFISGTCSAQSFFKSLPKPERRYGLAMSSTTPLPDSTFTGFRPIVSAKAEAAASDAHAEPPKAPPVSK